MAALLPIPLLLTLTETDGSSSRTCSCVQGSVRRRTVGTADRHTRRGRRTHSTDKYLAGSRCLAAAAARRSYAGRPAGCVRPTHRRLCKHRAHPGIAYRSDGAGVRDADTWAEGRQDSEDAGDPRKRELSETEEQAPVRDKRAWKKP